VREQTGSHNFYRAHKIAAIKPPIAEVMDFLAVPSLSRQLSKPLG